jgi:hypothetical protein
MFKLLHKKYTSWKKARNQQRFHKKLLKQYIKSLKKSSNYELTHPTGKILFADNHRMHFQIAEIIRSIAERAEAENTATKI